MTVHALPDWAPGECGTCRGKKGVVTVYFVRSAKPWEEGWDVVQSSRTCCLDRVACLARKAKRAERARLRATKIVICEAPAEGQDIPKGHCWWCGERIELVGPGAARRHGRMRHYGDEHEAGDRDCRLEHLRPHAYEARDAIRSVSEGEVVCADCGVVCERDGKELVRWDADHELALEDGGEHVIENLKCRCTQCHREKTGRENAARARARRSQLELAL